jgi:hypothetical protein
LKSPHASLSKHFRSRCQVLPDLPISLYLCELGELSILKFFSTLLHFLLEADR